MKRHRDAAIGQAQTVLAAASIEGMLSEHRYKELWQSLRQVAKDTDLVSPKCLSTISTDDPARLSELAKALRHVLYGEGSFDTRMQRFISACRGASSADVSWQLVTFALALVFPNEHICIHPASFREQARWLVPRLSRLQSPTAAAYRQLSEMARLISKKLTEASAPPHDMLDVADFIRVTTSPSARKAMLARKRDQGKPTSSQGSAEAA